MCRCKLAAQSVSSWNKLYFTAYGNISDFASWNRRYWRSSLVLACVHWGDPWWCAHSQPLQWAVIQPNSGEAGAVASTPGFCTVETGVSLLQTKLWWSLRFLLTEPVTPNQQMEGNNDLPFPIKLFASSWGSYRIVQKMTAMHANTWLLTRSWKEHAAVYFHMTIFFFFFKKKRKQERGMQRLKICASSHKQLVGLGTP